MYHMGVWLDGRVLVLHLERSDSRDSPSKVHVVHVILLIAVTWRGVDEPTSETPFFIQQKKIKKRSELEYGEPNPPSLCLCVFYLQHILDSPNKNFFANAINY